MCRRKQLDYIKIRSQQKTEEGKLETNAQAAYTMSLSQIRIKITISNISKKWTDQIKNYAAESETIKSNQINNM